MLGSVSLRYRLNGRKSSDDASFLRVYVVEGRHGACVPQGLRMVDAAIAWREHFSPRAAADDLALDQHAVAIENDETN